MLRLSYRHFAKINQLLDVFARHLDKFLRVESIVNVESLVYVLRSVPTTTNIDQIFKFYPSSAKFFIILHNFHWLLVNTTSSFTGKVPIERYLTG